MQIWTRNILTRLARVLGTGLAVCTLAMPATAQLTNGNFDSGTLSGWIPFNNTIPNVVLDSDTTVSGTRSVKIFGGFNGAPNYSGLQQGLAAQPGQVWRAQAHVRQRDGDRLVGNARVHMKIEFYSQFGAGYNTPAFLGEQSVEVLNASSPGFYWRLFTLEATAPAGTVEARISFVFTQPNNETGAALIDSVKFAPAQSTPPTQWTMFWNDEFDGPTVDQSKWYIEDRHLIKNNELQYYTPDDVYVQNGSLVLRSQQRQWSGFDSNGNWGTWNYTSGLVESKQRFVTAYGRVEVCAKLPGTQGIWPAHWMLPDRPTWPPEIDIMEMLGHDPTRVYMTHFWGTWPNIDHITAAYSGPDFTAGYHTFAVEWTPTSLDYYVDDVLRFASTNPNVPTEPFYIILNTAVGGNWPGNPNGSTVFPQYHDIDYVRVYMPSDPGPAFASYVDDTPQRGVADGVLNASEYDASLNGINNGLFGLLGNAAELSLESGADGKLNLALLSGSAMPNPGPYGVVIYIDSPDSAGFASTYSLDDDADAGRRLASGRSATGQRSPLFFAPGFLADHAIVLRDNAVDIYALGEPTHTLVNGATLGSATDYLGGTAVRYVSDGGAQNNRLREIELPLSAIGVNPGETLRFVATLARSDSAFRANEFIGVAPGNPFDGANPGIATTMLKYGDFVSFQTVAAIDCPGDLDGNSTIDLGDLGILFGCWGQPCGDLSGDGTTDLADLGQLFGVWGTTCP